MATYIRPDRSEKDIAKTMGKRIVELRHKKNWTQDDLAEKLDIDKSSLSRYEHGQFPKMSMLIRIADVLECDINHLLLPDKGRTPAVSTLSKLTGLSFDSIGYLMNLKKNDYDSELAIINSVLTYNRLNELLSAISSYKLNRDIVDGSSRKPKHYQMLFEEYTRYRVQPAYRYIFIGKMIKALKADEKIIRQIEEKLSPEAYNNDVLQECNAMQLSRAEARMVKDFYNYIQRLFVEYELTARELQIHRLFMNYLEY